MCFQPLWLTLWLLWHVAMVGLPSHWWSWEWQKACPLAMFDLAVTFSFVLNKVFLQKWCIAYKCQAKCLTAKPKSHHPWGSPRWVPVSQHSGQSSPGDPPLQKKYKMYKALWVQDKVKAQMVERTKKITYPLQSTKCYATSKKKQTKGTTWLVWSFQSLWCGSGPIGPHRLPLCTLHGQSTWIPCTMMAWSGMAAGTWAWHYKTIWRLQFGFHLFGFDWYSVWMHSRYHCIQPLSKNMVNQAVKLLRR